MELPYFARHRSPLSTSRSGEASMWFSASEKKGAPSGVMNHQRPRRFSMVKKTEASRGVVAAFVHPATVEAAITRSR
jgi:hypothetical protein